ncbi:CoA transferase [Microbacterium aurantiacum]|uniref:CoA transferase n=1 Tax=Microbacterium aurantiacum TaxID=162393 RepID=UPI000C802C53|nr:CoA transferase [Microbacterium aurantiacum]
MTITGIGRNAWRAIGGDDAALDMVADASPPPSLPSRLPVAALLGDAVALAALAIQQVQIDRGRRSAWSAVRLDGRRLTTSAQCERHFLLDGVAPDAWAPLSGFWQAADGWVRTHGNYPHHARRLAEILGIGADAAKKEVAAAILGFGAVDLETRAAQAGAIVGAVRTAKAWSAHAEGLAVATEPLVSLRSDGGARGSTRWDAGRGAPLDGIRVLDLTRVLAGPIAARDLAFAGADVLRIDSPRLPEIGWQHLETGHGKRSATLDLADAVDRRVFEELLASADVVITGYRPGSLDRFGLSAEALWEHRPGIIVGSVGAWSERGPWAERRGFDSIVQAVTGIAMTESADGATPGALPAQALDHSAGHMLAAAICIALIQRRREGAGSHIRVGLARLAHELLHAPTDRGNPGAAADEPTVQRGRSAAGAITTAMPPFGYPGGPDGYPVLASPWGRDAAGWR